MFSRLITFLKSLIISCVCFKLIHFDPFSFQRYAIASNLKIVTPWLIRLTIIFINLYDIEGKGVHATFDWNYVDDKVQISKFIDPLLDGNQIQVSSVAFLNNFAFSVPQIFFDTLNIKLREKTE